MAPPFLVGDSVGRIRLLATVLLSALLCAAGAAAPEHEKTPLPCAASEPQQLHLAYDVTGPHRRDSPDGSTAALSSCSIYLADVLGHDRKPGFVTMTADAAALTFLASFSNVAHVALGGRDVWENGHEHLEITIVPVVDGIASKAVFRGFVDPLGQCVTQTAAVRYIASNHQCTGAKIRGVALSDPGPGFSWSAKLSIPYAALDAALNGRRGFSVIATHISVGPQVSSFPSAFKADGRLTDGRPLVEIDDRARDESYIFGGTDIGKPSNVSTARQPFSGHLTPSSSTLAVAQFSDDFGSLLTTLDKTTKSILGPSASKAFACRGCESFQVDDQQPFALELTSTKTLGIDLSTLGTDAVPFSFTTASYPTDSGFKFIESGNAELGVAAFAGTTQTQGVARDAVVQYTDSFTWASHPSTSPAADPSPSAVVHVSSLVVSAVGVDANRSLIPPTPTPGPVVYTNIQPTIRHSTNSEVSLEYSSTVVHTVPSDQGAGSAGDFPLLTLPVAPVRSLGALVRFGSQYTPGSQNLDVAVSSLRDPAVYSSTHTDDKVTAAFALGFRAVGALYQPLDGVYDLHTGEHGLYAVSDVTQPVCSLASREAATPLHEPCHLRAGLTELKITAFRFSDSVAARDVAVNTSLNIPFFDTLSFGANYSIASLATSQAGRSNNLVISDAQGGRLELPNGQYGASVSYSSNTAPAKIFTITGGYSHLVGQNCQPTLFRKPPPCITYRSGNITGQITVLPPLKTSDFFLTGLVQNATNDPFSTGSGALLLPKAQDLYATTASHIVRTAGVGAHAFRKLNGCSMLLITTTNRGGQVDEFARSPPQPGFTNTALVQFAPGRDSPSLLVAFSRTGTVYPTPKVSSQFLMRVSYGLAPRGYPAILQDKCAGD